MKTIWKFPIKVTDRQTIEAPGIGRILHIGLDPSGGACAWAEVDTDDPPTQVALDIYGTGNPMPPALPGSRRHVGTIFSGPFVWHAYQIATPEAP